jgi:arylsulfatase A-like enzyme
MAVVTAATLAGALMLNDRPGSAAQGADPRNVLVVMTDDQRLSDLAKAMPRTKKRIGKKGVIFRNAYATFPLCCPSRATYLTGQYTHNHGVVSNLPPDGGIQAFDDSATTAVTLDAAGYRTGWVGKYLNGYRALTRDKPLYVPPGYDWWRAAALVSRMFGWTQVIGDRLKRWGRRARDYQTDVYARQAVRFLRDSASGGEPFFLTIAPFAPHIENRSGAAKQNPRSAPRHRREFAKEKLPRPPSFNEADVSDKPSFVQTDPPLDADDRRRERDHYRSRLRSMLAVDDLVVRVLEELRRRGLTDDTLIIFTSDNGYLFGEHRLAGKSFVYDESTKVPLLMRGPGVGRRVVTAPVGNVDLAATIYDWTGATPGLSQDGVSLLDVAGDPSAFTGRELVLQTHTGFGLRTQDWLYAEHETKQGTELELYSRADRFQLRSLHDSPEHAETLEDLGSTLDDLRDCAGAECH